MYPFEELLRGAFINMYLFIGAKHALGIVSCKYLYISHYFLLDPLQIAVKNANVQIWLEALTNLPACQTVFGHPHNLQ